MCLVLIGVWWFGYTNWLCLVLIGVWWFGYTNWLCSIQIIKLNIKHYKILLDTNWVYWLFIKHSRSVKQNHSFEKTRLFISLMLQTLTSHVYIKRYDYNAQSNTNIIFKFSTKYPKYKSTSVNTIRIYRIFKWGVEFPFKKYFQIISSA